MHRPPPTVDGRPRIAAALLLAAGVVVCFLALWIVAPPPHRILLPLAVGAPELSPWLTLVSALTLALTLLVVRRAGWIGGGALAVAVVALALSVSPLVRLSAAVPRFDAAMSAALGEGYLNRVPPQIVSGLRASPFVARDFVRGIDTSRARAIRVLEGSVAEDVPLRVDIYQPAQAARPTRTSAPPASGRFPIVVQIYGGSWQRGMPGDDGEFASALAAAGFVVFAIDYRHAPQWHWPAQIDDVREGLEWVAAHAAEFDGDVTRVALLGRSAGAQLALVTAYDRRRPAPFTIKSVVSLYGPVDLVEGWRRPPFPDPLDVRSILQAYLGGTPDNMLPAYRAASPITYVAAAVPSTLLIHGTRDHIVEARFSRELDQKLRESGARTVLIEIPWAEHAFDTIPSGIGGQLALYYTQRFLASELYGQP